MLKNENIICVSTMCWDDLWTRKQRFMNMLAKEGNKVLYVEPIYFTRGRSACAKVSEVLKRAKSNPFSKVKKVSENLYILIPAVKIPFGQFELISLWNQLILKQEIKRAQRKLTLDNPIFWTYSPYSNKLISAFSEKLAIYDCVDEHSAYPNVNKSLIRKMEERLIEKVDIVFVTTKELYEDKKHLNKNIFIIPNGVDIKHFSKACEEKTTIPDELQAIPKPRIGYIGGIADWIDLDLILYIAKSKPEWSLVLLGPIITQDNLNLLKATKNIYFLGRKDLHVLPNYLKGLDACLNPFKLNELTSRVNPLKVYEYLAAGKPVVSVGMPAIRQFEGIIKFAHSKKDFIDLINEALGENQLGLRKKRLEAVRDYSWGNLFRTLINYIKSHKKFKEG